jgi:hypothetical protein
MPNRTLTILFSYVLFTSCAIAGAQEIPTKNCAFDRARMLALDENQFDQDMSGGWRALSSTPGCELVAADLLRDYRKAHGDDWGLLYWHEAQLRAFVGQYKEAIALMKHSYMPEDKADWNAYVDATIAFLRKDSDALKRARERLSAVPPPVGVGVPPVIDGYMEAEFEDGSKKRIRWPINIDVVEGLENCFDKTYAEAYKDVCRPGKR